MSAPAHGGNGDPSRRSPLAVPAIERIWIRAAASLGFTIERGTSAYASSDGRGTITIGVPEILDDDDAVAQLVFHELCHAVVEGPEAAALPDWGLDNTGTAAGGVTREHACLRIAVHLAAACGLRDVMAPTTEHRGYHDALPARALFDDADPAAAIAREALERAGRRAGEGQPRWTVVLADALRETAVALGRLHPVGLRWGSPGETCGTCAWRFIGGRGAPVERCRQAGGQRTMAAQPACELWEGPIECGPCGACCREAYHVVAVSPRDPVVRRAPALMVRRGRRLEILRDRDRCAALAGAGGNADPYRCRIYDDRPRTCRDFQRGGDHCLEARRRVGLGPVVAARY